MRFSPVLLLASVAAASSHGHHRHRFPRRAYGFGNETATAPTATTAAQQLTTSVVYETSLLTVTDCPETVTNCPSDATKVVTSVIAVSTTICPVDSVTPTPAPSSDAVPPAGSSSALEGASTPGVQPSVTTVVEDTTLVYTIGKGSSTQVKTTTIKHTTVSTLVKTVYQTKTRSDASVLPSITPGPSPVDVAGEEPTTTIRLTSVQTKVVTVKKVTTSVTGVPGGPGGAPSPSGDAGACAPVTVTVTDHETVTVTVTPTATSPATANIEENQSTVLANPTSSIKLEENSDSVSATPVASSTDAVLPTGSATPTESDCDTETEAGPTATPTGPPYGNNGTHPYPTGTRPGGSIRFTRTKRPHHGTGFHLPPRPTHAPQN